MQGGHEEAPCGRLSLPLWALRGGAQTEEAETNSMLSSKQGQTDVTLGDVKQPSLAGEQEEMIDVVQQDSGTISPIPSVPSLPQMEDQTGIGSPLLDIAKLKPPVGSPTAALQAGFASVVKVFAWTTEPHFSQPWQMRRQRQGTGSGFIIAGKRILTNAHNVANQNWVLVQRHGIPKKYPARVLAVGHECDLALIGVDDDDFWTGTRALEFGDVPELQQSVVVVGFPTGGDNLCVTAGVVSRVDVHQYAHSGFSLLCVQIDAAVNAGNSGGPALREDSNKVIGVAFQGREDAENVGYIIPSSVVHHFLTDIDKNGAYSGFVTLGITWAPLENRHLRDFCGIDDLDLGEGLARSGVLVCKVDKTRHSENTLERGDTLLAIDGVSIADDGTIQFRVMERLAFAHLISQKYVGETCSVTILRDRKVSTRTVRLAAPRYLVPECVYDEAPRYLIVGGLVFVPLTLNYMLHEFGKRYYEKAPNVLLAAIDERFQTVEGEEVVVLSQILASEISSGYDGIRNIKLESVNGEAVRSMMQLQRVLETATDEFLVFGLSHTQTVVLRRSVALSATPTILAQHSIALPRSELL